MTSQKPTPPPPPRLPTVKELIEEEEKVREFLRARNKSNITTTPPRSDYEPPGHSPAAKEVPIMDQFWVRLGLVASAIWLALIFMISSGDAGSRHDFVWLEQYGSDTFGPATYYAGAGLAIIWAACLGIPWIIEARNRGEIGTPGIGSMPPKLNSANVFLGPVNVNDGTVARLINEPNGGARIEVWARGVGWIEAPKSLSLSSFMPGAVRPVSADLASRVGMPASEL